AALSTAGLVSAGAVVYIFAGGPDATSPAAQPPDPGQVHTVALRDMSGSTAGRPVMGLPAGRTKPFSLLGVSWDSVRTKLDGAVRVRTHSVATGAWSAWKQVEAGSDDAPDAGGRTDRPARGATAPLWVGPSNGVE